MPRASKSPEPHRAGQRTPAVAQLEVDPCSGEFESPHLAGELHPCELEQSLLELRGVRAYRVGPGELAVGNAFGGGVIRWRHRWQPRLQAAVGEPFGAEL